MTEPYRITFSVPMTPFSKPQGHKFSKALREYHAKRKQFSEWIRCNVTGLRQVEGPVSLVVAGVWERTKELAKVYKRTGKPKHPPGLLPRTSKPDCDNIAKAVADALGEDLGVFAVGDQQVVDLRALTAWAPLGGCSQVIVSLRQEDGIRMASMLVDAEFPWRIIPDEGKPNGALP